MFNLQVGALWSTASLINQVTIPTNLYEILDKLDTTLMLQCCSDESSLEIDKPKTGHEAITEQAQNSSQILDRLVTRIVGGSTR